MIKPNKHLLAVILLIGFTNISNNIYSQSDPANYERWKFKTEGAIFSTPVIHDQTLFVGSQDGFIYALSPETGKLKWKYNTGYPVSVKPLIYQNILIVESGNHLHALTMDGHKLWRFDQSDTIHSSRLDNWDFQHSSPVIYENTVYYGSGDGYLYGVNADDGSAKFKYASDDLSPIRSTPAVKDHSIFFGDWNGKVYGVDLNKNTLLWKIKTFDEKPYPNFGPIIYNMLIYGDLLYYGVRNPHMMALDIHTGKEAWSYTDPNGSWIPGNALVSEDVLYMGGSDNHMMLAFDAKSGNLLWTFDATQNIYSQPLLLNDKIIFTTFYSGYGDPKPEKEGYLCIVGKTSGKLLKRVEFDDKIISSPILHDGTLYFGSTNHNLYALDAKKILSKSE